MSGQLSFGTWLRQRRRRFDWTQQELADHVGCSIDAIFKFEAGTRRPSKQIAELLAQHLQIPLENHPAFIAFARGKETQSHSDWITAYHPPNNLPTPPTPLIGRDQDIASLRKRLLREDTQLLTLVGPPGIGKTRLSLAVAHDVLGEYADGVFLVFLASVSDPDLVARTIVQSLGIQEIGPQSSLEHLKIHLRVKHMLLVLDNFEQILPAAPQIAELLAACPLLKMLVTSRAPLRIRRERQFAPSPLALPDVNHLPSFETLSQYSAIELFLERAQAVKADFSLTRENSPSVTAICNRLDGLPLAIELISARIKLLPPAALLERLHGGLMLQSDGLRDLEPRHRTLNAAIGWSYDLLNPEEKMLFMRLGVFVGGWTLEASEEICQLNISILDGMSSLVDKSLIQPKTSINGEPRYMMLETIREYALERLAASGETEEMRRRHAHFYLMLARTPRDKTFHTLPQAVWLSEMDQAYDNLQAALDWCFAHDLELGIRLADVAHGYWLQRGRLMEGRSWLDKALQAYNADKVNSPDLLIAMRYCSALLAYFQDDLPAMRQHAEALLSLGKEHHDTKSIRNALFYLGQDALQKEDFERSKAIFEEVLALSRQVNISDLIASALLMLSLVAVGQKDYERAWILNAESLALYRQMEDQWGESLILTNNATIREAEGHYLEARDLARQSLRMSHKLDDKRTISQILEQVAGLMSLNGEHKRAVQLMGVADALRDSIFAVSEPLGRPRHDRILAYLRANLDENTFIAAWMEGRLMTFEQALEDALADD